MMLMLLHGILAIQAEEPTAEHFLVGEDLPRVIAGQLEHAPQQGWFVDPSHQQDVARDAGFDQRFVHITPPAVRLRDQFRRTWIAAIKDVGVQIPSERLPHFGVGPMGRHNLLETPGQAFREPRLDLQRRQAEQQNPNIASRASIGILQTFARVRPPRDFLDFIKDEHSRTLLRLLAG
jgi:hypothetical protein